MISSPGRKSHHRRAKRRDESIKGTDLGLNLRIQGAAAASQSAATKLKKWPSACHRTSGDVQSGNDPRSYETKRVQKVAEEQVKKSKKLEKLEAKLKNLNQRQKIKVNTKHRRRNSKTTLSLQATLCRFSTLKWCFFKSFFPVLLTRNRGLFPGTLKMFWSSSF